MTETDTNHKRTFSKEERLCSTKSIDRLFSEGESFIAYPLRVVYYIEDEADEQNRHATILISVSKKKFKRAVKRNCVKRLVREAFRQNKAHFSDLLFQNGKKMDIAFLYLKNELPTYNEIEKSILKTITVLTERSGENKEG